MPSSPSIAVIGGGPAGLRAAEVASGAGVQVTIYEAKPSVGRKFLVAGKSGLNLTNAAAFPEFADAYSGPDFPHAWWRNCLEQFDSVALRKWVADLGEPTFAATSGKVFPKSKKAAPLLRRWVERLKREGVIFKVNHRLKTLRQAGAWELDFEKARESSGAIFTARHDCVILAMGGGSWPQTGSDGTWVRILEDAGITVTPLAAANCGWEAAWNDETRAKVEGRPLQNIRAWAGETSLLGEAMLTRYGIEGTVVYQLGRVLRQQDMPVLHLDLKPTFSVEQLVRKMESVRRNYLQEAALRWKLSEAVCALLEFCHGPFHSIQILAAAVKDCRLRLLRPRTLDEAISTAGGVAWIELDENLMLHKLQGIFCAGEMIDWEAPTGGFLLQACFATGTWAGRAAAALAKRNS